MFLILLAVSVSQISTLPLSFPTARYDPSDAQLRDVTTGNSVSLRIDRRWMIISLVIYLRLTLCHSATLDSRGCMQTRHIPRLGVPDVNRIYQGDRDLVRTTPTDQVQVIIVHKPGSVQDPIWSLWELSRGLPCCCSRGSCSSTFPGGSGLGILPGKGEVRSRMRVMRRRRGGCGGKGQDPGMRCAWLAVGIGCVGTGQRDVGHVIVVV